MATRGEKTILVGVPLSVFWATITDYLAYPSILDDVTSAEIRERSGADVTVAFTIRVLLKGFDYTLRMREEAPHTLSWTLVSSATLAQNDGGWRLEAVSPTETRVTYWNEVAARAWIPKTFINALIRIALPSMLRRWQTHAEQRHASGMTRS